MLEFEKLKKGKKEKKNTRPTYAMLAGWGYISNSWHSRLQSANIWVASKKNATRAVKYLVDIIKLFISQQLHSVLD